MSNVLRNRSADKNGGNKNNEKTSGKALVVDSNFYRRLAGFGHSAGLGVQLVWCPKPSNQHHMQGFRNVIKFATVRSSFTYNLKLTSSKIKSTLLVQGLLITYNLFVGYQSFAVQSRAGG